MEEQNKLDQVLDAVKELSTKVSSLQVDMTEVKDKVTSLDGRMDMLSDKIEDMYKTLKKLDKRDFDDSNATSKSIIDLTKRVEKLEKQAA